MYKPDRHLQPLDDLISDIQKFELDKHPEKFVIIGGDLNLPDTEWENIDRESKRSETEKVAQLMDLGFTQMVTTPTRTTCHSATILDVILTNQPHSITEVSVEDGIGDHKVVLAEIIFKHKISKKPPRKIFLFDKGDVIQLKSELIDSLPKFTDLCQKTDDIDIIYNMFTSILESATIKCVPAKFVRDSTDPPWYNKSIRKLKKTTRQLHAKHKITKSPKDYEHYSQARSALHQAKKDAESAFLSSS